MKFLAQFMLSLLSTTLAAPQNPEINDQFEESNHTETKIESIEVKPTHTEVEPTLKTIDELSFNDITDITYESPKSSFISNVYKIVSDPLIKFISAPKVIMVIKNIGTCIVNGAMEIVSFYFPAPLIPLIASAAGLFIPFEPVMMLKERMPVTSYRRAFKTAVNSFLGTFDRYKYEQDDPYMTRRFNRRFMGDSKENQ